MTILVLCQRGNVRSVTVATILKDYAGMQDVIAAGVETSTQRTMNLLTDWADIVLVAGDVKLDGLPIYFEIDIKWHKLSEIGKDIWGQAMHPELVRRCIDALKERNLITDTSPNFGTLDNYLQAVDAKFRSLAS